MPLNNESARKRRSGKTPRGNKQVRRTLCERAQAAARTDSSFASVFKGIRVRLGYRRTAVAVAHRLLRTKFVLISRNYVQGPSDKLRWAEAQKEAPEAGGSAEEARPPRAPRAPAPEQACPGEGGALRGLGAPDGILRIRRRDRRRASPLQTPGQRPDRSMKAA
ncbi:MAG: transposase [Deltaproteobacteria bacterium]|nr:transposase [Deltaproteobacteria bacterium]